jgi:hypothetical protein
VASSDSKSVSERSKAAMYSSRTPLPGKQILRKGLSPLATTISTDTAAPVIAGMRLRAGGICQVK